MIDQCLQGIIYQRLLPDLHGVPHALMAYTFYEPHKSSMTWDQALTRIREKEQITHEVFDKEK
nr:hypothetical protein [Enterococcus gallinarum]